MSDEVQLTSLLPEAFTTGRWSGGRGTIIDVWYEYRKVQGTKGPFTVIETHVVVEGANDGEKYESRYGAGFADSGCIRQEPSEDSDEAEKGYGLSGRNGKKFELRNDSETVMLLQSAYANGVAASRIGNDIRGLIGVDAEWVQKPHAGVKDDKYPMLLITEVYSAGKGGAKKKRRDDDDDEKPATKTKKAPRDDDDDDEQKEKEKSAPKAGPAAAAGGSGQSPKLVKRAVKLVTTIAKQNDGATTTGDIVRAAQKTLKQQVEDEEITRDERKALLELLGDDDFYGDHTDLWKYRAKTTEVVLVD